MKHIIVAGARRSGTTFLGNLLNCAMESGYVEEPFNKLFGIKSIPDFWYPYLTEDSMSIELEKDLKSMFSLKHLDFRTSICNPKADYFEVNAGFGQVLSNVFFKKSDEKIFKRISRLLLKSNHYISYLKLRIKRPEIAVWKDPLMSLSLGYLLDYFETKVVFIYRHPAAFYTSMMKQRWALDFDNFSNQEKFVLDHDDLLGCLTEPPTVMNLVLSEWLIINSYYIKLQKNRKNCICISHDDLAADPQKWLKKIFSLIDVEAEIDELKLNTLTQSDIKPKSVKDVRRNSVKVKEQWKKEIDEGELKIIMEKCGPLYQTLESLKAT